MTRRIALAILLSVWVLLISGGIGAYWLTRSAMLRLLDESLVAYASSVPELIHGSAAQPSLDPLGQDRYRVVDNLHRAVGQPEPIPAQYQPKLLSATFSYAQGQHLRTVTLQAYAAPTVSQSNPRLVTVIYTASAKEFDTKLHRLALLYLFFGLGIGLVTAGVAVAVSKSALKPLAATNRQIASIDERNLEQRIDVAALPTELAPMAQRLNELLARLQSAFIQRNRFLADASHELRTPVAALVTRLQIAARHPRTAEAYRQVIEECSKEANQLRHLIEQLMQQVRSQNLDYDEPAEEFDLVVLLQQCAQAMMPLAQTKGITIEGPDPSPVRCILPQQRLRSVILNLLSNAIEYSRPNGAIELDCHRDNGHLQVDVTDNGVGIAPEDLPHIFQPFYRADSVRNQQCGHLGLGLSLVRAHLQAMHGTCDVTSLPGEGSIFSMKLPDLLAQRQPAARPMEPAPAT